MASSAYVWGALPVLPSASHPHAAQTAGATVGLEANKAHRSPALQQLAVRGGAQNLGRISGAERNGTGS